MIKYIVYDKSISMGARQFNAADYKGGVLLNGYRLGATLFATERLAHKAIERTAAWATRNNMLGNWAADNYVVVPVDVSRPRQKAKARG